MTNPPSPNEALREAAQEVVNRAFDHYRARNGRMCSIEGDEGEKCWIVPFDAMEDLRTILNQLPSPASSTAGEAVDLRPWGYVPGHYSFRCVDCPAPANFAGWAQGAKRSIRCEQHAREAMARQSLSPSSGEPASVAAEAEAWADLLTKAVGDITAALILAGKKEKIRAWTAPYIAAINQADAPLSKPTPVAEGNA